MPVLSFHYGKASSQSQRLMAAEGRVPPLMAGARVATQVKKMIFPCLVMKFIQTTSVTYYVVESIISTNHEIPQESSVFDNDDDQEKSH